MSGGKVVRNTSYLVMAFVGQKVLTFVYFTVIARTVGVEGAGRYFLAVSFTTMFSIFVDLGLANVLVREIAKFPDKAKSLLANVLGIKLMLAVLTVAAALVTARLLDYHPQTTLMISIACAVMVLDSMHLVLYAAMRGFQNLKYEAVGVVTGQIVIITVGSTFLYLKMPLHFLVVALLCGSTWNVIWAVWSLKRRFGVLPSFRIDRPMARFLWGVTIPFAFAGIFSRVYSYIDSIMISKLISEAAVGLYGVAYKIAFAFQFMPMAFAAALYPAMSEQYVTDRKKLGALLTVSMNYLMLIAVPIAFGVATLAEEFILMLYGPEFLGSVMPLQILMFSLIFAFLYWPGGSLLNATDRQALNTAVMGTTMVLNIVLNAILIPRLGIVGAAFAALAGNALLWAGAMWFSRKVVRVDKRAFFKMAFKTLFAGIVMSAALVALRDRTHVALLVPLAAFVYTGALFAVGGVTLKEVRVILDVLRKKGRGVSDLIP
ncbi:MAG: oligosaccharide flippase family protein [Patescibacteria group bacterium]|nr:oligosaccharide flippase family protein [Patescibacteria group bacterium]